MKNEKQKIKKQEMINKNKKLAGLLLGQIMSNLANKKPKGVFAHPPPPLNRIKTHFQTMHHP